MSNQQTVIQVKLQRSASSLAEANLMMQNGFYNAVVNRLYYACFYATQALLLTKNLHSKTHSGTATLLHKHFVSNSDFDTTKSSFFTRLMQRRERDDYNDFLIVDKNFIEKYIQLPKNISITLFLSFLHPEHRIPQTIRLHKA